MHTEPLALPTPRCSYAGRGTTIIEGLRRRRSSMVFLPGPVSVHQLARILNEAAGVTPEHGRGTPSPGRAYALDCYVAVSDVELVPPGLYQYDPETFELDAVGGGSPRAWLPDVLTANAALGCTSAFHVFVVAETERGRHRLGPHADELLLLEAGHLVQSMLLLAESEGLGACPVGRFDHSAVEVRLGLDLTSRVVHSAAFGIAETAAAPTVAS